MSRYEPKIKIKYVVDPIIGGTNTSERLQAYYKRNWGKLMSAIAGLSKDRLKYLELPKLRTAIKRDIKLEELVPLLSEKDKGLTRLILDTIPVFNAASHDVKVHIVGMMGVTAEEFETYSTKIGA